ncbi:hypothetical protein Tco_1560235 [Tanacetum coccineum]
MENFNLFYQDVGPSASARRHLTQEEAAKEELAIRISQRYALLEEERPVIETIAYNDKYKMILDEIWKDKVELDGKTMKEDKEAVKRIKGEALKEKEDLGAFIFPGMYENGVTTIIAKFIILDIPIDCDAPIVVGRGFLPTRFDVLRIAESDTEDEEEYVIKRNKFGAPIYGPRPAPYLNRANPEDRSSAIQAVTNPFRKIGRKRLASLVHYPYHLSKSTGSLIIKAHIRKKKKRQDSGGRK